MEAGADGLLQRASVALGDLVGASALTSLSLRTVELVPHPPLMLGPSIGRNRLRLPHEADEHPVAAVSHFMTTLPPDRP